MCFYGVCFCVSIILAVNDRRRQWQPTPVLLPGKSQATKLRGGTKLAVSRWCIPAWSFQCDNYLRVWNYNNMKSGTTAQSKDDSRPSCLSINDVFKSKGYLWWDYRKIKRFHPSWMLTEFKQGFGGVGEINTPACQRPEGNKWAGGANFNLDKLTQCLHSYPQQPGAS